MAVAIRSVYQMSLTMQCVAVVMKHNLDGQRNRAAMFGEGLMRVQVGLASHPKNTPPHMSYAYLKAGGYAPYWRSHPNVHKELDAVLTARKYGQIHLVRQAACNLVLWKRLVLRK